MEEEPPAAAAAGAAAGGDALAAEPVAKTFAFTAIAANWADEVDEEEETEGRESARAAILDQLKEKYHSRRAAIRAQSRGGSLRSQRLLRATPLQLRR